MPSADAILTYSKTGPIPEPSEAVGTWDEYDMEQDEFGGQIKSIRMPNYGRLIFGRVWSSSVTMMKTLGLNVDPNVLRAVGITMSINVAIYSFYETIRHLRSGQLAKELSFAAVETAECANPVLAWKIPIAVGAALLVAGSFHVGYKLGSGDWSFSAVNVTNPADRRRAKRMIHSVRG